MRILVLNYEYPPIGGGAAPVSRDIAEAYCKAGDKVAVITMRYKNMPKVSVENGVTVYRIDCKRKRKDVCSPIEQYSYLIAVKEFMRRHPELQQYNVCHTHFVIPTGQAALEIKKRYGIPFIITAHGSDVEGHNRKITNIIMHRMLRRGWRTIVNNADCIVSPSEYLRQRMANNYSKGRYIVIPNGVNYEFYDRLNKKEAKEKRILIMGRIQKFKNLQFIISAIDIINRNNDLAGWKIDVVGDGPYRDRIEKLVCEKHLDQSVMFYGWLDNKSTQLCRILNRASIYISASTFENCPMSVIEASIAGCYPLISDITAHRQMIGDDQFRFDLNDINDLVNKIMRIMNMEDRLSHIPDMSRFDEKNVVVEYRGLLDMYKR